MAASENLELARLEFENHGACYARLFARRGPDFFRQAADHWLRFCQRHIVLKGVLGGDGLGWPVWNNFAGVDTACELMQTQPEAAELLFEQR